MNYKKIIIGLSCCFIILAGLNYLLQQYTGSTTGRMPFVINPPTGGAAQYNGAANVKNSPYFAHPDIYNMQPNEHLLLLPQYPTFQQTTFYTCGPAAASTVVKYYKKEVLHNEKEIGEYMSTNSTNGTSVKGMAAYFKQLGWEVKASFSHPSPDTYPDFLDFVRHNLQSNTPIMVENVDWGGHWRVIIGYDTMNTETIHDDVLFFADPFDTSDHLQDGYNIASAERFFYMWFDHQLYPKNEQDKLWLTAKPKS